MPPSTQLGPVVAEWVPSKRSSVWGFAAAALAGVADVAVVAFDAYPFLMTTLPLTALVLLAWVGTRRSYLAVGDGWFYVRTGLIGDDWTSLSRLESGKITGKGGTTMLLCGPTFLGRVPVQAASMRRPTDFHVQLARRLLAYRIELDDEARFVLRAWARLVSADAEDG